MPIDKETIKRVAALSRLNLSEEEERAIVPKIEAIIGFVDTINELNTENVAPTYHVVEARHSAREDVPKPTLPVTTVTALAPKSEYDHIVVPQIIE